MSRGWLLLLCATLLLWRPLDFAFELPSTLSSLGHRGIVAVVEIAVPRHGCGRGGGGGESIVGQDARGAVC